LRRTIEEVLDRADEALSEARQRACGFFACSMYFDELPDRIARCGEELSKKHPANFVLAIIGQQRMLESTVQEEAYGIAGEALRNAFLNAAASRIEVEITYASTLLSVRVRDDGVGIAGRGTQETEVGDWRYVGMRERAKAIRGELQIWSRAAAGTEVELVVPAAMAYSLSNDTSC
jgi:signal transduction histidine kinase